MNKKSISRANLFLIELIIVIVFFILASGIILNVFVKANELTIKTNALNGAAIIMQSNAEKYKSKYTDKLLNDKQTQYYDKDWQATTYENAYYLIEINIQIEKLTYGVMAHYNQEAKFAGNNDFIYSLNTKKYFKR